MGRRYEYFCDDCKKDFGNKPHLNIKTMNSPIWLSFLDKEGKWIQKQITFPGNPSELHVCNLEHLKHYIEPRVNQFLDHLKKGLLVK